jgi:hypothetical protein
MQTVNSESSLREAILQLERKRADEGDRLKEEFMLTLDGLKPVNLVKSAVNDLVRPGELTSSIITTATGLGTGYLAKILVGTVTKSPFNRLLGTVAMLGISNLVARNPETARSLGKMFFNMLRRKHGNLDVYEKCE